jgi:Icc-related predicted phosphoesterase
MRLLGITDLHDHPAALERILADAGPADVVLLGGDITNFGSPNDAQRLVTLAQRTEATVLAVAGNCDSPQIESRLVELGVSLFRRGVVLGGVGLHGLSAMPPWRSTMYHFTEPELAEALEAGYAQILAGDDPPLAHVVLSHPPPRGGPLDRTFFGIHVGSTALREFIERTGPALVLCGHIHEGRGIDTIGQTTVVNCGPAAAGYYAVAEVGGAVRVELRKA